MRIEEKNGRLVIVDFNELEAFKIASKIEKDGVYFYEKLAEKITNRRVRDTLNLLASQERDHLEFFSAELFKLREEQQDRFEEDDLLSGIDYGIFQPYRSIDAFERELDSPRKVLRMGIIIEEKSACFYESCMHRISSSETRDGIAGIIKEEHEHKRLLEEMLARLA